MNDGATSARPALNPLLARSVQLRLFLALRQVLKPEGMMALRESHLHWVLEQERAGVLMLAGPVTPCGGALPLHGLMVFRAEDAGQAAAIAGGDPFVKAGVMAVEIAEWTIYEGSIPLTLRLSDSSLTLA